MNRTLAGLIGGVPELVAGALTAACILGTYYTLQERTPEVDSFMYENRHITPEPLEIRQHDDGQPYIVTSPLPEYIAVGPSLWDSAEPYDPTADHPENSGPPPLWLEEVPNADVGATDVDGNLVAPNARHDVMLRINASNVSASYLLLHEQPDGLRVLQLRGWSER